MSGLERSRRPAGVELLHDPELNKGTAFTAAERDALGLRGLLPPGLQTQRDQVRRVMENVRKQAGPLEKYCYLMGLQDRNEVLFYRVVVDHLEELMPLIYTPTVGRACQEYGHIFRRPRGVFISSDDRGRVRQLLRNWPHEDVRVIVVTDGQRILGLGDLGANGMGIPVGKLALYTACAGIHPSRCLPVTLDVGTDRQELIDDPLYLGLRRRRATGVDYDELIDEFVDAVGEVFPDALIQFEDFANRNAFRLLDRYRDRVCCFNDDIQGTAAVVLAGIRAALRITGGRMADQRILFVGAGSAAVGSADLITSALVERGLPPEGARLRSWLFDTGGLVTADRDELKPHKRRFAHAAEPIHDLVEAVRWLRPNILIGASGVPRLFTKEVIGLMAELHHRPVIFALSNPTSKSECTAEEAYVWTDGRAVFASGSPFQPVNLGSRRFVPGQGNNAYVFPGMGLGIVAFGIRRVTDAMFRAAADTLALEVSDRDVDEGRIFPPLSRIRVVSASIASAVGEIAYEHGQAARRRPLDFAAQVARHIYEPIYASYEE